VGERRGRGGCGLAVCKRPSLLNEKTRRLTDATHPAPLTILMPVNRLRHCTSENVALYPVECPPSCIARMMCGGGASCSVVPKVCTRTVKWRDERVPALKVLNVDADATTNCIEDSPKPGISGIQDGGHVCMPLVYLVVCGHTSATILTGWNRRNRPVCSRA